MHCCSPSWQIGPRKTNPYAQWPSHPSYTLDRNLGPWARVETTSSTRTSRTVILVGVPRSVCLNVIEKQSTRPRRTVTLAPSRHPPDERLQVLLGARFSSNPSSHHKGTVKQSWSLSVTSYVQLMGHHRSMHWTGIKYLHTRRTGKKRSKTRRMSTISRITWNYPGYFWNQPRNSLSLWQSMSASSV